MRGYTITFNLKNVIGESICMRYPCKNSKKIKKLSVGAFSYHNFTLNEPVLCRTERTQVMVLHLPAKRFSEQFE